MEDDDMIVPTADDAGTQDTNQVDDNQTNEPKKVEGALLDNDDTPGDDQKDRDNPEVSGGSSDAKEEGGEVETPDGEVPDQGDSEEVSLPSQPPEPTPEVEDPGEFTPKDYSFEVTLADGSKHTIKAPEDADLLPDDADFGSLKNFNQYMRNLSRMTYGIEADKRDYESKKEAFETHQEQAAELTKRVETMTAEVNYLVAKGKLPKVDPQYENADWNDPEVQKQPGVKETLELLEYRAKENVERAKLNLPPMSVLEAANERELEGYRTKENDTKTKQNNQRKVKGAMVGGATSTPAQNIPDDLIIGEGGAIRDIGVAY